MSVYFRSLCDAFSMDSEGKYFYCTVKENRQLDPKFVYYEL